MRIGVRVGAWWSMPSTTRLDIVDVHRLERLVKALRRAHGGGGVRQRKAAARGCVGSGGPQAQALGRACARADLRVLALEGVVDLLVEQLRALVVDVRVRAVGAVRLGVELVKELGEHLPRRRAYVARGAWRVARGAWRVARGAWRVVDDA